MPIGSFVAGDVLTAAAVNDFPGGVDLCGYAEFSASSQTGITTTADITNSSVTFTALAGRGYRFTCRVALDQVTSDGTAAIFLNRGGADVHYMVQAPLVAASGVYILTGVAVDIPGAGSFTYKLRASTTAGTLSIDNATSEGYLLIEDIGPLTAP
jgi:hypothetical protein